MKIDSIYDGKAFDWGLYGNDYRMFEKLSDDDVMRIIHGELSEEE